ncbi:MAG: F0F1 ATP synthase subunit delta [Pseudomonadota bacterium]
MADNNTIARPYAQAVFDVASESGELAAWSGALEAAGALLESGEIASFLANPSLSDEQRLEFLTGLFVKADSGILSGSHAKGTNFLKLLLENGRVAVLPEIAEHFEALKAAIENTVEVTVTSATPVSDDRLAAIGKALEARLGREVKVATELDTTLIGGAVIKAGDVVIDGSMRARLDGLAHALIN